MRLFKKLITLMLILPLIFLASCGEKEKQVYYTVNFLIDGNIYQTINIDKTDLVDEPITPQKRNCLFKGWYIDQSLSEKFDFSTLITSDITLYGTFDEGYYTITFETNGGSAVENQIIKEGGLVTIPSIPTLKNWVFEGWFSDEALTKAFDFTYDVYQSFTIFAKWKVDENAIYSIDFQLPKNTWLDKKALYQAFFGDFYDFLINNTDCKMNDINSKEEFLTLCQTWKVNNRDSLYYVGDRFSAYFLTKEENGVLENQPNSTFIGYCYQNNKYIDFIRHLITFFAYWRTDEGYSATDPHGNDFFYGAWASLVDTAKFFYFTADNLNDTYSWFTSARVKQSLDYIPGVGFTNFEGLYFKGEIFELPNNLEFTNYNFEGYYLDLEYTKKITEITPEMVNEANNITIYLKLNK